MHLPTHFFIAGALLVTLLVEAFLKRRTPWALPAAAVYLTVFAWYFADLLITPENYDFFPDDVLNASYDQVLLFLVVYRLLAPSVSTLLTKNVNKAQRNSPKPETLLFGAMVLWVVLLSWGITLMGGDILGAMFPIDSRAGASMWSRAAAGDAGATGFLISAASYVYILVCASFGVLYFFVRSKAARCGALSLMILSWPFFVLSGTRNTFLAVSTPFFLAYVLFGRRSPLTKTIFLVIAFLIMNNVLLVIISFRGVGFREYMAIRGSGQVDENPIRHQGLNMIQELCFIDAFASVSNSQYGARYVQELLNVVPRAIWPGKPLLGIDYAEWRGFLGGDSDTGVVATISSGLIGGGVLNFGTIFGPIAPAVFMAFWTGLLARWWCRRDSLLRSILFLLGLGLTFNLGRDITLLVLWPVVFGYVITRLVEYFYGLLPGSNHASKIPTDVTNSTPWIPPIGRSHPL